MSPELNETAKHHGVDFPEVDGRRSTSATGRAVVADALRPVDPIGASAAAREGNWRSRYLSHFHRLVEASLVSTDAAYAIADAGLSAVHERMLWVDSAGQDRPLHEGTVGGTALAQHTIEGTGSAEREVSLPHHGERLVGSALLRQLDTWVDAGVMEPSARSAVTTVIANPDWLRLEDRTVVVLGAAAEMGPLRALLRWGATVAAIDLPSPPLWSRVRADAQGLAGRLIVPAQSVGLIGDGHLGIDLIRDLPTATRWVSELSGSLVIGNYAPADAATNVRVSTAVDALSQTVRSGRGDQVALAFLATPTDVFAVPGAAVSASVAAYDTIRGGRFVRGPLRALSGGRLLRRNYVPGQDPGINDSVVLQQGPNYLLAKRIQRWRATAARREGATVSFRVAPPTRTRSVVKNRALAAAYAGAHRFGIEVFEPGAANTLMALLLVHDLCAERHRHDHPWQDEADGAVHGGLWRSAYDPRSALGLAAVMGAMSRH